MDSKPLLVAVDFSDLSVRAVDYATRLARSEGRKVDLLHVATPTLTAHALRHAPSEVVEQIRKGEEVAALRDLGELMDKVPESCRGRILLRRGPAADTICKEAASGYELVVVSTQGRTGLAHVLLGSVAEQVVRHAPIPVLVVR